LHPFNAGLLASGDMTRALVPCTPAGGMVLLDAAARPLASIFRGPKQSSSPFQFGRKPIAQLLLGRNATVTIAHSHTRDLAARWREPMLLWPPSAVRDDSRRMDQARRDRHRCRHQPGGGRRTRRGRAAKTKLVGDVAFAEAIAVAGAITPVPGVSDDDYCDADGKYLRAALLSSGKTLLSDVPPRSVSG